MAYVNSKIGLAKLELDLKNPRFMETRNQKEAIAMMLDKRGNEIYNIAKDILDHGQNPTDLIAVFKRDDGTFVVKDGNRRVTAMKLMMDPKLIDKSDTSNRKRYSELNRRIDRSNYKYVSCIVFDDEDEVDQWVERSHSGAQDGIGHVKWDPIQKMRFAARKGGPNPTLKIYDYVIYSKNMEVDDDTFPITTLQRLIDNPFFREQVGLSIVDKQIVIQGDPNRFLDEMELVIKDFEKNSRYKVADVISNEKVKEYVQEQRKKGRFKDVDGKIQTPMPEPILIEPPLIVPGAKKTKCKTRQTTSSRTFLIPKDVKIEIKSERINDTFEEMKCLYIDRFRNTSAVMLRILLEMSVDYYIAENKDKDVGNGRKLGFYAEAGNPLASKISMILEYGKNSKTIDESVRKNMEVTMKKSVVKIDVELNQFVHNFHHNPTAENVKLLWNSLEGFIRVLLT